MSRFVYIVWLPVCLLLFSCSHYSTPDVVVLTPGSEIERWDRDVHYLEAFFQTQPYQLAFSNAENNIDKQIDQLKDWVNRGVQVIILIPVQSAGYQEAIDYARQHGTRIIAYDRLLEHADIDFFTTFDNLQVGVNQANYLINHSRGGYFALINGPEKDNNAVMLRRGQLSVLNSYRLRHRVNLLADVMVDAYTEEAGYEAMIALLDEDIQQPEMVIAGNDAIARGVIRAAEERNLNSLQVVGQDADRSSLRMIQEGKQLMTVYKPIKRLANIAGEVAVSYLEGLSPDEYDLSSTYNGYKNVSTIVLGTIIVDKDNIRETVMRDGFVGQDEL